MRSAASVGQTGKERQEAFRARMAMMGNTEVRGIYAPPILHAAIKEFAQKLVEAQLRSNPLSVARWTKE